MATRDHRPFCHHNGLGDSLGIMLHTSDALRALPWLTEKRRIPLRLAMVSDFDYSPLKDIEYNDLTREPVAGTQIAASSEF